MTASATRALQFMVSSGLILSTALLALPPSSAFAQVSATTNPVAKSDYQLGAGDVIKITVYESPDLSLETRVSERGYITYPLLGQVKLGGLTILQAEKTLGDALQKGNYLKNPQINVFVTQVKGNQVSVLGNVNRPGRFPLDVTGLRLSDLLALAGGISSQGSDIVSLSGTRNGAPIRQEIDVPTLFDQRGGPRDPIVQDGDVLYVGRMPMIYIYGEVQRPGALRLERNMTLIQALAAGGGLTTRGTERGIRVNRTDADGKVNELKPDMFTTLQDGDVIYVKQSLF